MQNDGTLSAMDFAGLSVYETWMHYCAMGGPTDYFGFDAYLHGLAPLDGDDADLVSQAVNELIDDVLPEEEATLCRAPYSWRPASGTALLHLQHEDGVEDALPLPMASLAAPHTAATFGSLFLAGLDAGALAGRPGVPLPPGAPMELLGEILDSAVVSRAVSRPRQ
ncbi:hypothetical protein V6S67_15525 [Arthrobacter sp. Soc17.1.1.1]|jgi:hypothetical protein|uniref:hypothetical protein n=1 Tax=Arthrobacter sp. Soc17.1.1.1 TaxID=3121277 RepID=UPI002FE48C9E